MIEPIACALPQLNIRDLVMALSSIEHCPQCGGNKKDSTKKYCSPECYWESMRGRPNGRKLRGQSCLNCGAETSNARKKYCHRECYDRYRARIVSGRTKTCEHCGKVARKAGTRKVYKRNFCSHECKVLALKNPPVNCKSCGVQFSGLKNVSGRLASNKDRTCCSDECKRAFFSNDEARKSKISEAFRAEKHPLLQGGHGDVNRGYRGPGWERIAESARRRDKHTCQHCGKKQGARKLDVHHIVPFRQNTAKKSNKLSNLITLCASCHTKADHKYRRENGVQLVLL